MTIWWCAGCGMEDTRAHNACPSCNSALQVADIEWLPEIDREKETAFELFPEPLERASIVQGLVEAGISHRWEGNNELIVLDDDADEVDDILDEVLGEDTREGSEEDEYSDIDEDGVDDRTEGADNGYEVLSDLFVAADRLAKNRDEDEVADFLGATGTTLVTGQPFGIDEETWADIQSTARNLASTLESDPKASSIDSDLKALRNQLQQLV